MKKKLILLGAFLSLINFGCDQQKEESVTILKNQNKTKAPEIGLKGIYNKSDNNIPTIASLKGNIIILDFWATWCSPCIAEFPKNNLLYNTYKNQGVKFIAITNDSKEKLENFLKKVSLDFWIGRTEGNQTLKDYNIRSFPSAVIINKSGEIVYTGRNITKNLIEEVIATNTINTPQEDDKKITENKTSTRELKFEGRFFPGEDPVYIDFMNNEFPNRISNTGLDKANISTFMIRKSPYLKSRTAGYNFKDDYVGLTIVGNELASIYKLLNRVPSDIRIKNKSKDTSNYDIVYSKRKKGNDLQKAFTEIQSELSRTLSISYQAVQQEETVYKLTLPSSNPNVTTRDQIEDGASGVYTPISRLITMFENISKHFFIADSSLENTMIYSYDLHWDTIKNAEDPIAKISEYLGKQGITMQKTRKVITTSEIIDVPQTTIHKVAKKG